MMQSRPTPNGPYFIFGNKTWEIENKFDSIHAGEDYRTKVTFGHIVNTCEIAPEKGLALDGDGLIKIEDGKYHTYMETVKVSISGEYGEPEVSTYRLNKGLKVERKLLPRLGTFSLPMYVIEKLVKEAIKIDAKNRLSVKFQQLLEEMHD